MYRVFEPVEQGWQLVNQYSKLPKSFILTPGYQLEKDNADGSVTILESPDLEIEE